MGTEMRIQSLQESCQSKKAPSFVLSLSTLTATLQGPFSDDTVAYIILLNLSLECFHMTGLCHEIETSEVRNVCHDRNPLMSSLPLITQKQGESSSKTIQKEREAKQNSCTTFAEH